ncbi:uncharacterized protein F5891DRAFT_1225473 [Suillus fuscotomentosus]|uniref:Uncharacterized protein n=1 Tax=Suillus fuscotomentosus TaxID=1912939 RepID=A0AAD4E6W5_9AGAM|nr:uncharacterized protein F5891DRAFT_1225473 [Suillus fuscotomentosus]KAG1900850.1 hypothetical protein F5891DRAFT_1225473 [Suillus fuscotomentosus]
MTSKSHIVDHVVETSPEDEGDEEEGNAHDDDEPTDLRTVLLEELNSTCLTTNYFNKAREIATALHQASTYLGLPQTFTASNVAIHLNYNPTRTGMKLDDIADTFNIPDLCHALSDFLQRDARNQNLIHGVGVPRRSLIDRPPTLPFDCAQVWHTVRLQQVSYHDSSTALPAQTLHASPSSSEWLKGRRDAVLVNIYGQYEWPQSGLKVSSLVDIDRLLCDRITSIGVPVGGLPCTLDTIKPLLKCELEFCVIHEGVGNAVGLHFEPSIFNQIVPRTNIKAGSLKLIKYNRLDGPPAYSSEGWTFNRSKRVKQSEDFDSDTDILQDNEGSDTEINRDIDSEDDEDSGADDGSGAKLNYEGSLRSAILRGDQLVELEESWDGLEFKNGSKKRQRRVVHTTETDLQCLFYTIQYHLCNTLKDNIPYTFAMGAWYWTAEFSTTAIPDEFNAQKPDLSLFDFALLKEQKSWANVLTFVEHTSSDLSKNRDLPIYWGVAIKTYLIMREQPWRQFVLAYSISVNMLHAHYFDCSGIIIFLPFYIHKCPSSIHLCDALAALTLPDRHHLGLDPTC